MRFIKFGYSLYSIDVIRSVTFDPKEITHEAYVIRLRFKDDPMEVNEYFYFNRSANITETPEMLLEEAYARFYEILGILNR